jgi:hypothetical protein
MMKCKMSFWPSHLPPPPHSISRPSVPTSRVKTYLTLQKCGNTEVPRGRKGPREGKPSFLPIFPHLPSCQNKVMSPPGSFSPCPLPFYHGAFVLRNSWRVTIFPEYREGIFHSVILGNVTVCIEVISCQDTERPARYLLSCLPAMKIISLGDRKDRYKSWTF